MSKTVKKIDAKVSAGGMGSHTASVTVHYSDGSTALNSQTVTGGRGRWAQQIAVTHGATIDQVNISISGGVTASGINDFKAQN